MLISTRVLRVTFIWWLLFIFLMSNIFRLTHTTSCCQQKFCYSNCTCYARQMSDWTQSSNLFNGNLISSKEKVLVTTSSRKFSMELSDHTIKKKCSHSTMRLTRSSIRLLSLLRLPFFVQLTRLVHNFLRTSISLLSKPCQVTC